jgi:putative Mg2+ transporter-C (MgtC) family protein
VPPTEIALLARLAVGFALAFVIGFERELRGSPAGDRTFGLIGGSAAALTATVAHSSPQALAGVITGVGFIGAGVVVQYRDAFIRGITTASAIFATACIGIVVGTGHLGLGAAATVLVVVVLELRNIPALHRLDARHYQERFRDDDDPPRPFRPR